MLDSIELSKIYNISTLEIYGGEKIICSVIGTTNIDNVANNEDNYNIYERFFSPIGLGMGSYYAAIRPNTTIYICRLVTSLEPLQLDDEKVFIPESLIDKSKSFEYVECDNLNVVVYPLIRRFTSEEERNNFLTEIKTKIKNKLNELIDFVLIDKEVDITYDSVYVPKESIDTIEKERTRMFTDYLNREYEQTKLMNRESERNVAAREEMLSAKKKYETAYKQIQDYENRLNQAVTYYEQLVRETENLIKPSNNSNNNSNNNNDSGD